MKNIIALVLLFLPLLVLSNPSIDENKQKAGYRARYDVLPNLHFKSTENSIDLKGKMRLTENLILLGEIEMDGKAEIQIRYIFID